MYFEQDARVHSNAGDKRTAVQTSIEMRQNGVALYANASFLCELLFAFALIRIYHSKLNGHFFSSVFQRMDL